MKLYGMTDSGNCYKPRLLLAKLGIPYEHIEISSRDGSTRKPDFLARNPNGRVPVLELDDGRFLCESNAILLYLAEGSRFLPADPYQRALVYQWLFFEQYSHEPFVAVRRALMMYPERAAQATPERLAATLEGGNHALHVIERQVSRTPFLAGKAFTVADIALYAYTHDAHNGGVRSRRLPRNFRLAGASPKRPWSHPDAHRVGTTEASPQRGNNLTRHFCAALSAAGIADGRALPQATALRLSFQPPPPWE